MEQIRGALNPLDILVDGLPTDVTLPVIEEDGATLQDNARKKATTYAQTLNKTVLSVDNGLYLDGLPSDKQPGPYVRRIPGHKERPSDEELLKYYASLIKSLGGRVNGHWEYAICVANPKGAIRETTIKNPPRIFVDKPCSTIVPGYPLESIQIELESGKYIAEMTKGEQDKFWQKTMGSALADFIQRVDV